MSPSHEPALRLSVWQPASFSRAYFDPGTGKRILPSDYQEEIYTWDTGSHDLFGLLPVEVSERVHDAFAPFLDSKRAPSERSVLEFRRIVLGLLDRLFGCAPSVEQEGSLVASAGWSESQDTVVTVDGEMNLRVNTPLGVLRHYLWIAEVFSSIPGASVLLR